MKFIMEKNLFHLIKTEKPLILKSMMTLVLPTLPPSYLKKEKLGIPFTTGRYREKYDTSGISMYTL